MRYVIRDVQRSITDECWVIQLQPLTPGGGMDSLRSSVRPDLKPGDQVAASLHLTRSQPTPPAAVAA